MTEVLFKNFEEDRRRFICDEQYWNAPIETRQGSPVSVMELWSRYVNSEWTQHMNTQPYRFTHRFGYERSEMFEDLGIDVEPIGHQLETGLFVIRILEAEMESKGKLPIPENEIGISILTALVHDSGETMHPDIEAEVGATIGDIPAGEKTDHDRAIEAAVRAAVFDKVFPDLPGSILEEMEMVIGHKVDSPRHDLLEAAHSVQTYNTSVAAENAFNRHLASLILPPHTRTRDVDAMNQLLKLKNTVQQSSRPHVLHYAQHFSYLDEYARRHGIKLTT